MNQSNLPQEGSRMLALLVVLAILLVGAIAYLMRVNGRSSELRSLEERLDQRLDRLEQHLPSSVSSTRP